MGQNVGDDFQTETKYLRTKRLGGNLDWANKPETYKNYPSSKTVQLPSEFRETLNFTEVLRKRKSTRSFSTQPLSLVDLAYLLWASTGIQRIERGYEFRVAPSAGALYPIETYIAANNVEDLARGIYHYNIKETLVGRNKTRGIRRKIGACGFGSGDVCGCICGLCLDGCFWEGKVEVQSESVSVHLS